METSDVRRQITQTIERARRGAADRRARNDEVAREYGIFLEQIAVPLFRQVANVLKAENYSFRVFTPSGSVRLMSETHAEDYIELSLDTSGDCPAVMGSTSRAQGRRVIASERQLSQGSIRDLTEQDVLDFLATEFESFVRR